MADLVQIADGFENGFTFPSFTMTATFRKPVTPGNCIVAIAQEQNPGFRVDVPVITDSGGNSYSSIVGVTWNGGRKSIYSYVALNALAASTVTATYTFDTADRQMFIAEYSGVLLAGAIDGTATAADIVPPTTSVVLSTTMASGPVSKTMRFLTADSSGFGGVLFGLKTSLTTDIIIASDFGVVGSTSARSSVSGLVVQRHLNPPPPGINRFAFYFDPFGGNRAFGGPSNQGPPG